MRRKCIAAFVVVLAGAVTVLFFAMQPRPRLTEEQIAAIEVGMTLDQVEAILGFKGGDYTHMKNGCLPMDMWAFGKEREECRAEFNEWAADAPTPRYKDANGPNRQDAFAVRVWFDPDGKVIDKCRMSYGYTAPSLPTQTKWWLIRCWTAATQF